MMPVTIPIAGFNMDLYIPFRQIRFSGDNCIPEIGAVVAIGPPGIDYTD